MLDRLLHRSKTSRGALAVVTGAGSGIGAAFALELGKRGGTVVCSDIDRRRPADGRRDHRTWRESPRNPL